MGGARSPRHDAQEVPSEDGKARAAALDAIADAHHVFSHGDRDPAQGRVIRALSRKRHSAEKSEVKKSDFDVSMGMKGRATDLVDPAPDPDEDQMGRLETPKSRELSSSVARHSRARRYPRLPSRLSRRPRENGPIVSKNGLYRDERLDHGSQGSKIIGNGLRARKSPLRDGKGPSSSTKGLPSCRTAPGRAKMMSDSSTREARLVLDCRR
jgi:hypothetical protein